ncbi:hypothetical protein ACFQ0D_37580, partial [Micromonospora zhanjiangensis]
MSEDNPWRISGQLSPYQVRYFQQVLVVHANSPTTGVCPVCGVPRCDTWVRAYDALALAGEPMADPSRWGGGSDPA